MAELADALDLGSSGQPWGFDSLYPHHLRIFKNKFEKYYKNTCFLSLFDI